MLESIWPLLRQHWPIALTLLTFAYFAKNRFTHGLEKYPGPFLASLTDWWRFFDVLGRRPDITHIRLHRELGDIVRLGPNVLSFADPNALKTIYGLNRGFLKTGFYTVQIPMSKGEWLPSLFSTTDESYHAALRRSVNSAFSMSALVQYEPLVDDTTEKFLDQTEALYSSTNAVCDFAQWLQFYAFDVIGQITYSKRHGFVDRNEDVDGIISYLGKMFSYVAPIGQIPMLDLFLLKNPILGLLDKYGIFTLGGSPTVAFARAHVTERVAEMESRKAIGKCADEKSMVRRGDLLSMFLKAKEDRPDFFDDRRLLVMANSMATAGSETTAITLSALFYYCLKNPRCYNKLVAELDTAVRDGTIENRPTRLVTWTESQKLPYLDACVKEAFRLHPAAGLPLERVVPPQGAEICGKHIPGGTIVGCNAWVIHRRPEIFGSDVDVYRPERWIEAGAEKKKEMDGCMIQFGMGARTCIGKNVSLLEVYKLVPSFLRRFEVNLANPAQEWKLHNAWFVKQLNFHTTFKPRRGNATAAA